MLRIRPLAAKDFGAIIRLTNKERWGFGVRDLKRMLSLEPKGCLVAILNGVPIGLTTAVSYGKMLGWIGNVVVDVKHRGAGVGSSLVESAIRHLLHLHVRKIGLFSYLENKSMYEQLNFRTTGGFARLSISRRARSPTSGNTEAPFRQILRLDKEAFGADRRRLLERLLREFPRSWAWILKGREVSGYSVVKQYQDSSEMGPSVCKQICLEDLATLFRSSLALARKWPLEVSIPESNPTGLETAARVGFRVERKGLVMSFADLGEIAVDPAIVAFGFLDKG
mgnify:CR=1 FL=1